MPLPRNQGLNQRLLTAIFAAHPKMRLDYNAIAEYYGYDTTAIDIEGRIRILRMEGLRVRSSHPRAGESAETPTATPRTAMTSAARRNTKRVLKNTKKGYDYSCSSSESSSSSFYDSDAPKRRIKKARKVEDGVSGSKASKPICIDSDDDSSSVTVGYGVQKIEDSPTIKKEMRHCPPVKSEFDPAIPTSAEPLLYRRSPSVTITGENPCVRHTPFVNVGGDRDLTVANEPDDEKKAFLLSKSG